MMTPTLPLDSVQRQQQQQLVIPNFGALATTPSHAHKESTPSTMGYLSLGHRHAYPFNSATPVAPQLPLQIQQRLATLPQNFLTPHKYEAIIQFLRPFRRSLQKWAVAAISVPYDSARLHALDSQIEGFPGVDMMEKTRLMSFIRVFGKRDRKRPRDRLLRDKHTKAVVMDVRKRTAFLGYTWRRMRPVEERPTIMPAEVARQTLATSSGVGVYDGGHGDQWQYGYGAHYGSGPPGHYNYGAGWWGGGVGGGGGGHWANVNAGTYKAAYGQGRFSWR
ncbi:hypothetical protein DL546_003242 [Coniochaeta pulveracea]|uniref:Uncharacterized protein n=1 Tax=Coniochaeta pulveracea TaxID=177199 RepID=A0A420Y4B8_9PEZI|nr:hypothetical protein DL546_003242 [Coniochaeta pulveracea]